VITAVPAVTPVTTPVAGTTVALALPLLQVPPGTLSDKVIVEPIHTANVAPVIAAGAGFTVTIFV